MLIIRKEQMGVFEAAVRRTWHLHLASTMREVFPKDTAALSEEALLARVTKADEDALKHRVETRPGIMRFVGLTFLLGENCFEAPHFQQAFSSPDFTPEEFIRELSARLPEMM